MRIISDRLLATFQARGIGAASPSRKLRLLLGSRGVVQSSWFLTQTILHIMRQRVP